MAEQRQHWWTGQARTLQVGIGCAVLIVVCGGSLLILGLIGNSAKTPAVAAKATATTYPRRAIIAYTTVVTKDSHTVGTDAGALGPACGNGDASACSAALVTFDADVQAFQQDLKDTPAPACLKTVDTDLNKGLALYDSGAQTAMKGIDQVDAALIRQGSATIGQGTTYITKASSEIPKATC
jgi:hypothetical protein